MMEEQNLSGEKMESFTNDKDGAQGNEDTWEDPYTCCGCIPIKCGMILLTVGSYFLLIGTVVSGM